MSEHDEQKALMDWTMSMEGRVPELHWIYAVPNGTRTGIGIAARMKQEGTKKGVPDLCLPVPRNGHGALYIEMKTIKSSGKKSYPEPEQREWLAGLEAVGNRAAVCWSWVEAAKTILEYLGYDPRLIGALVGEEY